MQNLPLLQKFLIVVQNTYFVINFSEEQPSSFSGHDYHTLNLYCSLRDIIKSYKDDFNFRDHNTKNYVLSFEYNQTQIILKCKLIDFNNISFEIFYMYDEFSELFLNNSFFCTELNYAFKYYVKNSFEDFLEKELRNKFQQFSDRFIFEKLQNINLQKVED